MAYEQHIDKQMEPLLEITNNINLSQRVLEVITENEDKQSKQLRVERLRTMIDEMQLQLKVNTRNYKDLQSHLDTDYNEKLKSVRKMYQDLRGKNEADELCKCFQGLLQDSLNLRKINLIGAKMKIYSERMRTTSFMELLNHF